MPELLLYLFILLVIAALILGGVFLLRGYAGANGGGSTIFGPRAERRLAVVEQASVDGRRRLVIVRRDDVEHLILTGGPVDVVIETGIGETRTRAVEAPAVYSRGPRTTFGQANTGQANASQGSDRAAE